MFLLSVYGEAVNSVILVHVPGDVLSNDHLVKFTKCSQVSISFSLHGCGGRM